MKIGVSTASLFSRKNNEDALPYLNELGVECAEVFLTSFSEYSQEFGKLLAERKGGVQVHSLHVLNTQFEPQLFNTNERVKKDAFYWLNQALLAAKEFGASHYTFHGTARYKKATISGKNDDFPSMQKGFAEIFEFCQNYQIKLCLENVEWSTYNRLGVFSKIREAVPDLGGVLDVKQARITGIPYQDYLLEMGESLTHVHVSDFDHNGKIRLPGQGNFDFSELVARLKDVGFDGKLLIEVYKDNYKDPYEIKTSVDFLNEILYQQNCLK